MLARVRQPSDLAPRPVLEREHGAGDRPRLDAARVDDPGTVPGGRPGRARLGERRVVGPCRRRFVQAANGRRRGVERAARVASDEPQ
jgi:hypothetical protein